MSLSDTFTHSGVLLNPLYSILPLQTEAKAVDFPAARESTRRPISCRLEGTEVKLNFLWLQIALIVTFELCSNYNTRGSLIFS